MGTYRNNLSPLPLYDSLDEQLHRRPYSHGYVYPLYVHPQKLIPFFTCWVGDTTDLEVSEINIYNVCDCGDLLFSSMSSNAGDFNLDFSRDFHIDAPLPPDLGLATKIRPDGRDYSILRYLGTSPDVNWGLTPGQFYLEIILSNNRKFFSEVFTVVSETALGKMVMIEWFNSSDLLFEEGYIPYSRGYKNKIYLPTDIGRPEYPFEEEGKDRDGYFFPEKQISKKTFRFTVLGTESLYDSMRLIGMSDFIEIVDSFGRTYHPTSFSSEIEWLEDGYLAEIQCEFNTDTVIKTVGKPIY